MNIDLAKLEVALARIIAHARQSRGATIEVPDDLYWFVQKDAVNDPTVTPSGLTLGSLEDDWEQLERVARGEREALGYDFVWASSVLRALGDRIP